MSGTVGYGKRIWDTFTFYGSVIESSNQFADSSLGFIGNLNGITGFGAWELQAGLSYAQNVQTLLITYTESYYNYNCKSTQRSCGRGAAVDWWFNGNHSGFSREPGTINQSVGFSTSLSMRYMA